MVGENNIRDFLVPIYYVQCRIQQIIVLFSVCAVYNQMYKNITMVIKKEKKKETVV